MNRVVITGVGAVTPFGFGVKNFWDSLLALKNGIGQITDIPVQGDIVKIASMLPKTDESAFQQKFGLIPDDKDVMSYFYAVDEAMNQADLKMDQIEDGTKIGVFIADRTMGSIVDVDRYAPLLANNTAEASFHEKQFYLDLLESDLGKQPFDYWESINHFVSRYYHITGPQLSPATACASGNSSIGEAFLKIKNGFLDKAIAGGAYNYDLSVMIGFTRLGALTENPDPETACRPFDANRSGFVMGSGCGIVILEDYASAKKRGCEILAEIKGYGYFSDAYRSTDPDPEAVSAVTTIASALNMAGLNLDDIDYINAHGTSTKMNDRMETLVIKKVFKDRSYQIPISSTKSMIGHSIMASAALECIVCVKSIQDGSVHATRNWQERDFELDLDYVPCESRRCSVNHALSNSFGFGGQNTCIAISKFKG